MPLNDPTVLGKVKRNLSALFDALVDSNDEDSGGGRDQKIRKICLETKFSRLSLNDEEN